MSKAADRLASQLEEADERIMELENEVERFKDARPWTEHEDVENDNLNLPVPRLEMLWEHGEFRYGYQYRCKYRMVYRHFLGQCVAVPLGETLVGTKLQPDHYGEINIPFRDGAHIKSEARSLNLPAYVRWDGKAERIDPDGKGPSR